MRFVEPPTRAYDLCLMPSPHPHAVRAADFDNDGHMDIVVDNRDEEGLLILPGLGNLWSSTTGGSGSLFRLVSC